MNISTPAIKKRVQTGIIESITRREYHQASREISDVLVELYAGIPDKGGDMFWNRKRSNILVKILAPTVSGFGKSERSKPDVYIDDGDDLSQCGFDARVLHLPGHSKGSVGIMTARGDLFCGDLLENTDK